MLDFIFSNMSIVWVVLMVVFLVVEAATAGLTCIWFAIGSLAALIAALFGAQIWLQVVWFLVISFVTLYFTRPLVKKYVNSRSQPTNADMVIGKEALVTEDIDNVEATGAVSVGGKVWTARSADGVQIKAGAVVNVLRIEGVKLIVEPTLPQN
ncbi:MAG: NfeD family protein [Candidatus Scatomorpha sp.]|jgi:membrane protein implicated in regulation of membrane protease activity